MSKTAMLGLVLLAACAQPPAAPPGPQLMTPAALQQSLTDPSRSAVEYTSAVFASPRSVVGRPAAAAEAVADLEWLTVSIGTDQRWIGMQGPLTQQLQAGRAEMRRTLGIPAEATPNAVIGAMDGAAAALRANNRAGASAALAAVTGAGGGDRALGVLSALPALPAVQRATMATQQAMNRLDQETSARSGD